MNVFHTFDEWRWNADDANRDIICVLVLMLFTHAANNQ